MSAYDITEFLRTAYQPFAYSVPSKTPLNTAYLKGGVTLIDRTRFINNIDVHMSNTSITLSTTAVVKGFRCDASVLIVTGSSLNRDFFSRSGMF